MINTTILEFFKNKNVLITGGTGMIGREVAKILCDAGAQVTIVSLDKVSIDLPVSYIYGDLCDFSFCKKVTAGSDCVFHIAGVKGSMEVSKSMLASHFVPTMMMNTNLLEACRKNEVNKVVYTSSIGAYAEAEIFKETEDMSVFGGPPLDFAGWAKRMGELQVHAYKMQYHSNNFSVVRPAAVYGPGDNFDPKSAMMIPAIMSKIHKQDGPIEIWGNGTAIRDIAFSRDIAKGLVLALYHGSGSSYLNLGSGSGVTVKDIIETLQDFIEFDYVFDTSKPSGASKKLMDISRAQNSIGYYPETSLQEGLRETWDWYINNLNEHKKKQNYFK